MNDLSNKYAIAALKNTRATLAAEIVQLERQLRHRKESLLHVDATLRLMDGDLDPSALPKKRLKRVKLYRQGELNRLVRDALREAGKPISAPEIVSYVLKAGGHDESARPTIGPRVRGNLAYLERRRIVSRSGDLRSTKWWLTDEAVAK
jgi:hypothetical protein